MKQEIQGTDKIFNLISAQAGFIKSEARYPAYVAGWGTGKSTALIARAMILSEKYPNNLGVIFRKEFTDLRDSTIRDFESYTGLKVGSERSVRLPNGSEILFRHLEELNNIQNMNLGWFGIEQAEELETDDQFFKLHGRLRRENVRRTGFVIANTNGHNWIYKLWKISGDSDYPLFEATSFDAQGYLPPDTMESWRKLEKNKPKIYRRFVLNSWDESDVADVIIQPEWVEKAMQKEVVVHVPLRRVVAIDVARYGDDKTVFYAVEGDDRYRRVIGKEVHDKKSTMEIVGLAQVFARKHGDINSFAVDEIGVGAGVVDRLHELGKKVIPVNSSVRDGVRMGCYNRRAEIYVSSSEMFEAGRVQLLRDDEDVREELSWTKYKTIKSSGIYQVEAKDDVKARYGRSPDHSDALLYGLWALRQADAVTKRDKYDEARLRGFHHGSPVAVLG